MEDEIKSAREIALEKVAQMGEATPEERLNWKYGPVGEQLAAKYINDDLNLIVELDKYPADAKKFVARSASAVLIRNLGLPKNDIAKKRNKKAMDGLKLIKNDKAKLENVYSQLRHLFSHYAEQGEQQRKQAYQMLKEDMEAKFQQAAHQQLGAAAANMKVDVEKQPQFQQEWLKMQNELDAQYLNLLSEYKKALTEIP